MTIKIKWIFLVIWLTSIALFAYGQLSAPSNYASMPGNPWGSLFGTSVIVGIIAFILMIAFFAFDIGKGKSVKPKKATKKLNWKFLKNPASLIIALLVILASSSIVLGAKYKILNKTVTPTPIPLPAITTTPSPTNTPNTNPIITCNIAKECGGGSQQLKKSICDNKICCLYDAKCGGPKFVNKSECGNNITCCGLNDGTWVIMDNDKCNQVHNANKPATTTTVVTQPSTGLNYYCYDNTYKYWYYTSSGSQCNIDNLRSSCKGIVKATYDMCMDTCLQQANSANKNCTQFYGTDLYKTCEDKVTADHQSCMDGCSKPYQDGNSNCNNIR